MRTAENDGAKLLDKYLIVGYNATAESTSSSRGKSLREIRDQRNRKFT